jgi:cell division protein FtsZ
VNLIFGAVIDDSMDDEARITVIATGFERSLPQVRPMAHRLERSMPRGEPLREKVPVETASGRSRSQSDRVQPSAEQPAFRFNDLEIPAFLRKRNG